MAKKVTAVFAYTPRVKQDRVIEFEEMVKYIADRNGYNSGVIAGA